MAHIHNGDIVVKQDDDLRRIMSSTKVSGLQLSINADASKFDISAGVAEIVDNTTDIDNPTVTTVNYAGSTGNTLTYLATANVSYISIDVNGNIIQSDTTPIGDALRDYVEIGVVTHPNKTSITSVDSRTTVVPVSVAATVADFSVSMGIINASGNVYTPNGTNLQINKSSGSSFSSGINSANDLSNPNITTDASGVALNFVYEWRDGAGGTQTYFSNTIQPAWYDDDTTGSTTHPNGAVSSNKWTIMPVRFYPASGFTVIDAGQALYNSAAEAEAAIKDPVEIIAVASGSIRAWLIVRGAATDLSDPNDGYFILAGKFGEAATGAGTGVSTTTLQQAYDNSTTPEVLTDTTRGALSVKRGTAADTDAVFEVLNGAGTGTVVATGEGDLTSLGTVTGVSLSGELLTPAQPNITSVGALDGGSITSGFGSIDTGADDITTTGTVSATTLAGTLSTAAQTNVTSVGTLTSLEVAGDLTVDTNTLYVDSATNRVGVGTLTPAESFEVSGGNLAINNGYNIHFNGNDTNWRLGYTSSTPPSIGGFNAALVQRIYGTEANYGYVITDDSDTVLFEIEGNDGRTYFSGNMGLGVASSTSKLHVKTGASTVTGVDALGRPLLIEDDTNCRLGLAVSNSLTTNDAGLFVSQPADAGANNIKWDNFTAAATSGKLTLTVGNAASVDMTSTAVNLNKTTTVTGDLTVNAATSTGGVISNFNTATIFYGHKSYNSNASGRTCVKIESPNTSNASGGAYVGYTAGTALWVAGARPSGYYSINSSNDMIDAAVRLAVYNNGHVVLGETTPTDDGTNMLQVTGSTAISSNLTVDANTLFVDATNNRVGIGTISPRSLLDVESATGGVLTISTSDTTVVANDTIGKINFYSSDASAGSAGIVANIEAVAATGDATDLHLRAGYSTGAGDPTLTDAVVIKSAGNVGIGTTTPSVFADLTLESGALCMKETTTPTADTNYGKIYTKSDNKLYFQDGAGTEHEIAFV